MRIRQSASRSAGVFVAALVAFSLLYPARAEESENTVVFDEYIQNEGNNNNGFRQAVGGIKIDAEGVVKNPTVDEIGVLARVRRESLGKITAGLDEKVPLRKVSLKRILAAIKKNLDKGEQIPDDVLFLAGMQRVRYVFVYPEEQDIVLAGPAEGWKVDDQGNFVGKTTGQPVILLEDLLVALRVAIGDQAAVTCSIDPKAEGVARLLAFVKHEKNLAANPAASAKAMEDLVGGQVVTFGAVPPTSHFAGVLVAADYRMKRLGMGLDPSPVKGMTSYLEMSGGSASSLFPRWWLTTNYDSLLKSPAGDAWELRGVGVKAMTEDARFEADGNRKTTGKASPLATKWADSMTKHYEELSAKLPVFTELRNAIDLAVVAHLIIRENLDTKAGLDVEALASPTIPTSEINIPREIPSQASFTRKQKNVVISVSGGIEINPAEVIKNRENSEALSPLRTQAAPEATVWQWWWN